MLIASTPPRLQARAISSTRSLRPADRAPTKDPVPVQEAVECLRAAGLATHRPLDPAQAEALSVVYRNYGRLMRAAAGQVTGDGPDAEDVVHDVMARLPRLLVQYRGHGLGGWLRRVVRNQALMQRRRVRTRGEVGVDEAAGIPAHAADPLAYEELELAVSRLPGSLRDVVVLRFRQGRSHREIAELLGISATASEVRLHRGIRCLHADMHAAEHTPTSTGTQEDRERGGRARSRQG